MGGQGPGPSGGPAGPAAATDGVGDSGPDPEGEGGHPGAGALYAEKLGVTYGRITIRCQKSRWGSCSSRGDLSFNCTLMKCPPEALDSVVAHELCHRKEMNHSARFYAEVLRVFPDYPKWHRWLKETGSLYLPGGEK